MVFVLTRLTVCMRLYLCPYLQAFLWLPSFIHRRKSSSWFSFELSDCRRDPFQRCVLVSDSCRALCLHLCDSDCFIVKDQGMTLVSLL